MPFVLQFVQKYRPGDRDKFMALEARFSELERNGDLPQGQRLQPYSGRESTNTLIWRCQFSSLAEAEEALSKIAAHPGHDELYRQQVSLFLDAWTEIYEVLEFECTKR